MQPGHGRRIKRASCSMQPAHPSTNGSLSRCRRSQQPPGTVTCVPYRSLSTHWCAPGSSISSWPTRVTALRPPPSQQLRRQHGRLHGSVREAGEDWGGHVRQGVQGPVPGDRRHAGAEEDAPGGGPRVGGGGREVLAPLTNGWRIPRLRVWGGPRHRPHLFAAAISQLPSYTCPLCLQMEEEGVPSTTLREVSLLKMLSESNHIVKWVPALTLLVTAGDMALVGGVPAQTAGRMATAVCCRATACPHHRLPCPCCTHDVAMQAAGGGACGGERQALPVPGEYMAPPPPCAPVEWSGAARGAHKASRSC